MTNTCKCRACKSPLPTDNLIQFHNMPKSAQFFPDKDEIDTEKGIDITLKECKYCGLVQAIGEPVYYYRDVIRASGVSTEMMNFRLDQYKNWVEENCLQNEKVIEIGCGRGEYLQIMEQVCANAYGLENMAESVNRGTADGHKIYKGFVETADYEIPGGPYKGFYIMNFLEHIPEPDVFLRGIVNNLTEDGVGIVEVPNFDMMTEKALFSEFMQDHLLYFTKNTLRNILESNGFEVISCEPVWYDYILSAKVRVRPRTTVQNMREREDSLRSEVLDYLRMQKAAGKRIATWGAGHQALANLALLDMAEYIDYVLDSADFKQNKYTPATHIPIVAPDILAEGNIDLVIIMAAGYSTEISRIMDEKYPDIDKRILGENGLV